MRGEAERAVASAAMVASAILFSMTFLDVAAYRWSREADDALIGFWRAATVIGDSGWMLASTGLIAVFAAVETRRAGPRLAPALGLLATRAGFCFAAVLILGLLASLAKFALGRARPKLFDAAGPFDFTLLAFDYKANSFPSGHATTLFALATALALIAPRWRAALYAAAAWGAFSRVAVSAHYVSDAVAGAALGHWGTLWLAGRAKSMRWALRPAEAGRSVGAALDHLRRRALSSIATAPSRVARLKAPRLIRAD